MGPFVVFGAIAADSGFEYLGYLLYAPLSLVSVVRVFKEQMQLVSTPCSGVVPV